MSAICHGPAALNLAIDTEGKPIVVGRRFTGLWIAEEAALSSNKVSACNVHRSSRESGPTVFPGGGLLP